VRSAAGTPYDEPPRRSVPSPSGTPYDEPPAGRPAANWDAGYDRDTRYDRDGRRGAPGYDPDPGRGGGYAGRGYSEPEYPDSGGHRRQDSYPGSGGARPSGDRQSGWPPAEQQQGWPQDYRQPGSWPQDDQQHGWPRDHSAPGRSADGSWYPAGQEGWPDQPPGHGDALEALPPPEEVHHDWSARRDRTARGWPAPGQDEDGEAW
jgi:hypothetical protein